MFPVGSPDVWKTDRCLRSTQGVRGADRWAALANRSARNGPAWLDPASSLATALLVSSVPPGELKHTMCEREI